jgi:hypothetical protein
MSFVGLSCELTIFIPMSYILYMDRSHEAPDIFSAIDFTENSTSDGILAEREGTDPKDAKYCAKIIDMILSDIVR